ncbi:hypothetical protein C9890_0606 [Perkinsus sp. BL_2016]|nr:hypothetical protein C9890_0606 [Perkinsus sp. BL_2016]
MSLLDDAGLPAQNPNKVYNSLKPIETPKWNAESLKQISNFIAVEVLDKDEFDKLDNPFLNGLKNFSKTNLVYCKRCDDAVKVSVNGAIKSTFQFDCKKGGHHISATQILSTLPDEIISGNVEAMETSTRIQTLKWLDKCHLDEEIWEVKGLKNATKRFAIELSPIKTSDNKIRAVNSSLEGEVKELKRIVEQLMLRQDSMELENSNLRKALKAAKEEADMLRRLLAEEPTKYEKQGCSFSDVAAIHRPEKPNKQVRNMTPIEVISKFQPSQEISSKRPTYSPLKIVFYEGCHRKNPSLYRRMFKELGIDTRAIRDITFLADELMQLTTYESAVEEITKALKGVNENVRRLESFDPTKAESYSKYGDFNDIDVKKCYFSMMEKNAERIGKAAENVKALRRSANFFNKLVENQTFEYQTQPRKPKVYFLGSLLDYAKPVTPPKPTETDLRNISESNPTQNQ